MQEQHCELYKTEFEALNSPNRRTNVHGFYNQGARVLLIIKTRHNWTQGS